MIPIVYHRKFAMGFPGMGKLHAFDSYRARRVYAELQKRRPFLPVAPHGPVTDEQLQLVHTPEYLVSSHRSAVVAQVIEVPPFAWCPRWFLDWILVTPIRWAVTGTLLGAREALQHGLAFSLAGGFHHAKPGNGEGFCLFSDIGYAVRSLKLQKVAYVDLDAHQGNGVCHVFADDRSVRLFDIYNGDTYPVGDQRARERLDVSFPLRQGTGDQPYLAALKGALPAFLDPGAELLIYNAGTDVLRGDPLGGLSLSPAAILERDLFVIREARRRAIPVLVLPSGGYTRQSYLLMSDTISAVLKEFGGE